MKSSTTRRPAARRHSRLVDRLRGPVRQAVLHRAALHARSAPHHADAGADGDDGDSRHLRAASGAVAQSRHRLQHGGDRADPADLRREARPQGQDLPPLDAEPASDADPGDRNRLGRERALLRRRTRHGSLRRATARCLLHGPRRFDALEPHDLPARRAIRGRPVHRLDPADGWRRQLVDGHARAAHRLRRRAEHGPRSARPPPCHPRVARSAANRQPARARPQARRADGRDVPGGRAADHRRVDSMPWRSAANPACRSRRS